MKEDATKRMLAAQPGCAREFEVGPSGTSITLALTEDGRIAVKAASENGAAWSGTADDADGVESLLAERYGDSPVRFCAFCGMPMELGFTDGEDFYACEECFERAMDDRYPSGWRDVEEEGELGGFYEGYGDEAWEDTGIYYTEWGFDLEPSSEGEGEAACPQCGRPCPPQANFCPHCGCWNVGFLPDDAVALVRQDGRRLERDVVSGGSAFEEWQACVTHGDGATVFRGGRVRGFSRPDGSEVLFRRVEG